MTSEALLLLTPISTKSREIPREFEELTCCKHSRSRSSKVIDLGVSQKCIYNFLLVINSNVGCISYRFQDIDVYS